MSPTRRTGVAALGVAVIAVLAGIGAARGRGGAAPDPALERRVLMQTIAAHERRLAEDPDNPLVAALLVRDHMAAFPLDNDPAHLRRAARLSESLVPTALDTASALARVAAARLSLHDFGGALDASRRAVASDPADAGALGALYDAAIAAGAYPDAAGALRALLEHHPAALGTRLREARWLEAHGLAAEGLARLEPSCVRLRTRAVRRALVAWCETILAGLEGSAGRPDRERAWLERALDTQPGYLPALEGLADLAHARGEWHRAARLYRGILGPAHPDLYLRLAEALRATGEETEAASLEARFVAAVRTPEAEALQAHELAVFLVDRAGRPEEALAVAERDVAARRSVEALEILAWVRLGRGEPEEALAASDEARRWGRPGPTSDYTRARILEGLGRSDDAARLMERALAEPTRLAPRVQRDLARRREAGASDGGARRRGSVVS